jgi:hypothetical protein
MSKHPTSDTPVTIVKIRLDGTKVWFIKQALITLVILFALGAGLLVYGYVKIQDCQSIYPRKTWEACLRDETKKLDR